MKKYEVMYIIRPNVDEEGKKNIIEKINNVFVKAASTVSEVKEWGLRGRMIFSEQGVLDPDI